MIEKHGPQVLLSSGDEIYAPKEPLTYDYFFKWYLRSGVGNAYHFRPSYQWNGTREVTPQFVSRYTRLLNDMGIPYAWQVEGRNLAASRLNPSLDALAGQMFRGKQAHENDGGYYYWTQFRYVGLFSDIAARTRPYGGIFAKCRPIFTDHGDYIHYDRRKVTDMADGARYFVSNLRQSKGESTRHTGPSTLFRYFYQAGYDWLGAEQMYGPEEKIMSALRGASRAYSKPDYGSLHAMQWLRPYRLKPHQHRRGSLDRRTPARPIQHQRTRAHESPESDAGIYLHSRPAWTHGGAHCHNTRAQRRMAQLRPRTDLGTGRPEVGVQQGNGKFRRGHKRLLSTKW